ncbi:protein-L-isoaspartate O-methyltransferase [Sulfuriferula multivorans]|uniref:Protein-L-isoaspartate O-methyltransferase n=2 Tax=Sulfuricellaceae TaxID=2772226 RepID=A0A401JZ80_9PROT|nr:protein-L-isoaspartate(D-aspartate) O-methyltransferase [Sulfuriferula multivorans]GCB01940.1 protein-L-isoaspartate O-methyltransferase [Sulfuriferula multivorans]
MVEGMSVTRHSGIGMTSERTRARMVERLRAQGIKDNNVLTAMGMVPRHIFVDEALSIRAYEDSALPIGFGQTISSPYSVARMIEVLRGGADLQRVLEVGTGCGYQAAVLAKLAREVYSVERIATLLGRARRTIRELRIGNIKLKHGDGSIGLKDVAPFDGIILAAAIPVPPQALLEQLAEGGRMVLPRGIGETQQMVLIERTSEGFQEKVLEMVHFVPLLPGVR